MKRPFCPSSKLVYIVISLISRRVDSFIRIERAKILPHSLLPSTTMAQPTPIGSPAALRSKPAGAGVSIDNIIDGNRRKRAKFEASNLPLFKGGIPQTPTTATTNTLCSDEDAAIFLMRLSDPQMRTPFSAHAATHSTATSEDSFDLLRSREYSDMGISGLRCIRCKRTKKGCDRQTPCSRCIDAGHAHECAPSQENSRRRRRLP